MKKTIALLLCIFTALAADTTTPIEMGDGGSILVHNAILAKINDEPISVLDVKKRLDMVFYRNYPHLIGSTQARLQFYQTQWRSALIEMVDQQLILADAEDKKVPLSDGEVREEMENRFGPNIMLTLDKMGLGYDETWKMVKNDLIVQRMSWWFIHAKAMSQVTPQDIRQAFHLYVKENPAFEEWTYKVIAVRGKTPEETAQKLHQTLLEKELAPGSWIEEIEAGIQVSAEFTATDKQISEAHKQALMGLQPGQYSAPILQKSKTDQQLVGRIFYLEKKTSHPSPQFDLMVPELRNQLIGKASAEESSAYMQKLRKTHTFYENVPDDLNPFTLQ
jgi:hypothetical protein